MSRGVGPDGRPDRFHATRLNVAFRSASSASTCLTQGWLLTTENDGMGRYGAYRRLKVTTRPLRIQVQKYFPEPTDLVVLVKMPTVRMVAGSYSGMTTWGRWGHSVCDVWGGHPDLMRVCGGYARGFLAWVPVYWVQPLRRPFESNQAPVRAVGPSKRRKWVVGKQCTLSSARTCHTGPEPIASDGCRSAVRIQWGPHLTTKQ